MGGNIRKHISCLGRNSNILIEKCTAKFLVSLTVDSLAYLMFFFLSYRKTTEKEVSQAKSLVNALDFLMELVTISTVPEGTLRHCPLYGVETRTRRQKLTRALVWIC